MYNYPFNVLDYVKRAVAKNPIASHTGNIEHSQTILSLSTDLPHYEIKSPENLKKKKQTAIQLDKI